MSKNLLRSIAIAAVFAGGYFATDVIAEPTAVEASTLVNVGGYQYSQEVVETLNIINAERKKMGYGELKINPMLSKSAEAHAKYLTTNVKNSSHSQTKGKSGFTGESFTERAKSAGYTVHEHSDESVTYGTNLSPSKVVNANFEGVLHRDTVLNPNYNTVGIGINGGAYVIVSDNTTGSEIDILYAYPYNGQTNVPTTFTLDEVPNPLAIYGVKQAGYIISASPKEKPDFFGEIKITLKDSNGVSVTLLNKNSVASIANAGYYVVPKDPLKAGEKYTATIHYNGFYDDLPRQESWSFTTAKSGTSTVTPTPTPTPVVTTPAKPDYSSYKKKFADFDEKQWWAADMVWAVDRGLIQGYGNVWNSKTKKYETQLQPNTQLTEFHFLTIFFRYAQNAELAKVKNTTAWNKSGIYGMASKYKMPVLATGASAYSKGLADKGIRRGKLAQLLASYYHGKTVSEATGVDFLIKNNLTTAKTVKEYNSNQILTRSQISAFVQRYDAFVKTKK